MEQKRRPYYADPTANAAIGKVMKEYKQQQKIISNRQYEIRHRPKVYIVSRYAGDVKTNIKNARRYCRFAVAKLKNPLASRLLYPQFLDDNNSQDREFGINAGLSLLSECDELWYFGDRVTRGMTNEICFALKHGIRVKYIPEHLYEQYKTERTMTHEM